MTLQQQMIPVSEINPKSSINVRRNGVNQNVEKLRPSLRQHGYLPEFPALLRPDPDREKSGYRYEVVSGQCRVQASRLEAVTEIPAVVADLDDTAAHLRSFNENDKRNELSPKDKAYWFDLRHREYRQEHGRAKALEMVAEFYETSVATVRNYLSLSMLPEPVLDDIAAGIINQAAGKAIAAKHRDSDEENSDAYMKNLAEWLKSLSNADRKHGVKVIENTAYGAGTEQLAAQLEREREESKSKLTITIPTKTEATLAEYGRRNGITDTSSIIGFALQKQMAAEGITLQ